MPFDMGWNYRASAGYVTDNIHYGVPVLFEIYPHTYTNGDGQSVNAGWDITSSSVADRASGNDPRIAGINYGTSGTRVFTVDLASGSAPGAGAYTVDIAAGDARGSHTNGTP